MGIAILEGRDFDATDDETSQNVIVISRAAAKRWWPGESAVGKVVHPSGDTEDPRVVVGVVGDVKIWSLGEPPRAYVYWPFQQDGANDSFYVTARGNMPPGELAAFIRGEARSIDPEIFLTSVGTMDDHLAYIYFRPRMAAAMLSLVGGLALVLACIGLYGMVGYGVSRGTREMWIRLALGADRQSVVQLVLRGGLALGAVGGAVGIALSLGLGGLVERFLVGVDGVDVLALLAAPVLLGLVAVTATYVPARRASRVDPVQALRTERGSVNFRVRETRAALSRCRRQFFQVLPIGAVRLRMDPATTQDTSASTSRARAFYELTKPGIAGYVMITAGASAFVASSGTLGLLTAIHTMLGTGIATAGALSLNQYAERDYDAKMIRTRGRPLPSKRLEPMEAFVFGATLLLGGLIYLALAVGTLPAAIAAASALAYHGVYTPLKTRSYVATLAGALPGALPMLIGWTAATNSIDRGGLALFAIGYLWQLPHVLGLAWMLREDYARVGFKLIPGGGARVIGFHMVLATGLLVPVSWLPTYLGYTGMIYAVGATALGAGFMFTGVRAAMDLTDARARRLFFASLLYHPLLLAFMLFDTVRV